MPPSKVNTKKEAGRAKKSENEAKKKDAEAADKERKEADKWADGSKTKNAKEDREEKRKAELARKAEKARLLAEEEASMAAKPKPAPKAGDKKKKPSAASAEGSGTLDAKPAGPGAIAAGGGLGGVEEKMEKLEVVDGAEPEVFTATGIDDALELLEVVTAKKDKASVGQQAAGLEKHPERRFKAALEAYQERELPNLRAEHRGLRLQQYKEILYKQFQKSPENPFNQVLVSYDATKEDKLEALERKQKQVEERLRERSDTPTLTND
ncbi:DUF1014-domain-containing protein [Rickenella mellea]|uniref:DUF1014-domain-containing protein n=1 Tax=Rickenella mellea TaxID=50990 RepID=A0A4Y7PLD4_9AGAM|nr:DUF1014-domain-containing protein [Rickenella mellea]